MRLARTPTAMRTLGHSRRLIAEKNRRLDGELKVFLQSFELETLPAEARLAAEQGFAKDLEPLA
jgi:hypothetical protein